MCRFPIDPRRHAAWPSRPAAGFRRLLQHGLLLAWVAAALPGPLLSQLDFDAPPAPGLNYGTVDHGGFEREFALVIPGLPQSPRAGQRRPLLVAFHGTGGEIDDYADRVFAGLIDHAVARGWFVLLPQALPEDPTAGGKIRWNTYYRDELPVDPVAADDLDFVRRLVAAAVNEVPIDPRSIYAAGFSGGGTMAQLLAATTPEMIRAVATSGSSRGTYSRVADPATGTLLSLLVDLPAPESPIPALVIHGSKEEEEETKRPYAGGVNDNSTQASETRVSTVWDQVDYWLTANGCRPEAQVVLDPPYERLDPLAWDVERFRIESYRACRRGPRSRADVLFVTAIGLNHRWPSLANWSLDGDLVIVDFLSSH